MSTFRYRYTRLNLRTGEQATAYRDFGGSDGGVLISMILFISFLNDSNKAGAGQWQYWADDLTPTNEVKG